jgi:hypothetical protein
MKILRPLIMSAVLERVREIADDDYKREFPLALDRAATFFSRLGTLAGGAALAADMAANREANTRAREILSAQVELICAAYVARKLQRFTEDLQAEVDARNDEALQHG